LQAAHQDLLLLLLAHCPQLLALRFDRGAGRCVY